MAEARRLFFALWPDAGVRAALARLGQDADEPRSRPVAPDNLHLTLAFLGNIAPARLDAVHAAADVVDAPPFVVELDSLEQWARPQLLCLVATRLPAGLDVLVDGLRGALAVRGLPSETRPFRAHVTLLRKVRRRRPPAELPAILRWAAERFWLVASESRPEGVRYTPLRSWDLAGPASGDRGHVG